MASRRSNSVNEEAKFREKHHILLQEYLVLQKECVTKKRKVKDEKERKQILLDEIRFLKQRRKFLLKMHAQDSSGQQDAIAQPQQPNSKYEAGPSGRFVDASESMFQHSRLPAEAMWNSGSIGKEKVGSVPLRIEKKPKNLFPNGKRSEKRKITWQDQVALKV